MRIRIGPAMLVPAIAIAAALLLGSAAASAASATIPPPARNFPADVTISPAPTMRPPPPCDFLNDDLAGAQAALAEQILTMWGFKYYAPDGKWLADDAYELSLFQRWAGLPSTSAFDARTRGKMLEAWFLYGAGAIPRQKLPLEGRYVGVNAGHQQKANYQTEPESPESGSPKKAKVSSGTAGVATRNHESAVNLAVALKLRNRLQAMGARVMMSRTAEAVNISNGDRARAMNAAGVQVVLILHCDGSLNHSVAGLHTLIPGERGYQTGSVLTRSQRLARIVQQECIKATGARDRGFSTRRDLTSFNWSKLPVCLVEMGFMTNAAEDRRLATPVYQEKIASGMARAIVRYFAEVR